MKVSGTTLLEILIATIIMALALIPVAGMIGFGHAGSQKDFRRIEAIHFTETAMNQALRLPYSQISTGNKTTPIVAASGTVNLGVLSGTRANYTVNLNITDYPVSFRYNPVDINGASYDSNDSSTWTFLADTDVSTVFDGSSAQKPIKVRQLDLTVKWTETSGVEQTIRVASLKADLED